MSGKEMLERRLNLLQWLLPQRVADAPRQDGGVHATRLITEKYPQIRVVVLTMHTEDEHEFCTPAKKG